MELNRSLTIRQFGYLPKLTQKIPSVASKRGQQTKKHFLIECQTWRILPPNIWGRLFKQSLS